MNTISLADQFVKIVCAFPKVMFVFSLLTTAHCEEIKYNVYLVINGKDYTPGMTWDEIREADFKNKHESMRVFDSDQRPISLFRFIHDGPGLMPLDKVEVHISTPIIISKEYATIRLIIYDGGNEIGKVEVKTDTLKSIKGGPPAHLIVLNLP